MQTYAGKRPAVSVTLSFCVKKSALCLSVTDIFLIGFPLLCQSNNDDRSQATDYRLRTTGFAHHIAARSCGL
jgi:hypothetical protein